MTCQLHALPGRKAGEDLAPRFFDLLFDLRRFLLEADAQGMGLRMLSEFLQFALQFHDRFLEIKIVFHSRRRRLMVHTLVPGRLRCNGELGAEMEQKSGTEIVVDPARCGRASGRRNASGNPSARRCQRKKKEPDCSGSVVTRPITPSPRRSEG